MNSTQSTPVLTTFVGEAILTNIFCELVPPSNWRDRVESARALAADKKPAPPSLAPSQFFSVKGDMVIGDQVVRAEVNIDASIDGDGDVQALGIERQDKDGNFVVLLPPDPKSHVLGIACQPVDGRPVPVLRDGQPVQQEPFTFGAGWQPKHACKYRVNVDPTKALKLGRVKLSYRRNAETKELIATQGGHLCVDIHPESMEIVDAPSRLKAAAGKLTFKLGASAGYSSAARRTAAATAPELAPGNTAEDLAEKAVAAAKGL